ncbi:CLUMA_CG020384, isoform A [Clunio marinus]|uniref:CLUMA_CG020384, isoform A n=1 Tax=Clunio marinus TaxID=568069 RepID=A0A1J1J4T1_9DIPT|nr:CLUMA_CG020384, isoform A [Clunio marinus]
MAYCKSYGKDKVMFVTKKDHAETSNIKLPESEPQPGLLLSNGDINWNCPCLGGMATGPCGVEFREAFSCFHYSEVEPKGSDCYDSFKTMQDCMSQYPAVYNQNKDDVDPNMNLDLNIGDDFKDEDEPGSHSNEYADGEEDARAEKNSKALKSIPT